jgi:diguanylate cyclase (GGDEF)-like protein
MLGIGEDTTEVRGMQDELRRQALHDPLTGLPNRRRLLDRLDQLAQTVEPGQQAGLCFVDLDEFKTVNDRYGHGVGDRVLARTAARLRDAVSGAESGAFAARIGGDEFVVLFEPPCTEETIAATAEAVVAALAEPIYVDGHWLSVSVSVGAVLTVPGSADPEALLDAADTGMYRAKQAGRGRWILHRG